MTTMAPGYLQEAACRNCLILASVPGVDGLTPPAVLIGSWFMLIRQRAFADEIRSMTAGSAILFRKGKVRVGQDCPGHVWLSEP